MNCKMNKLSYGNLFVNRSLEILVHHSENNFVCTALQRHWAIPMFWLVSSQAIRQDNVHSFTLLDNVYIEAYNMRCHHKFDDANRLEHLTETFLAGNGIFLLCIMSPILLVVSVFYAYSLLRKQHKIYWFVCIMSPISLVVWVYFICIIM